MKLNLAVGVLALLAFGPCIKADSFTQFTASGFFGPDSIALSGGFIIDETTDQVASVDMFYIANDYPGDVANLNLNLFAYAGPERDPRLSFPDILVFETFDSEGDELILSLVFPGSTGSFAGYSGGQICGYNTAGCTGSDGTVASGFVFSSSGVVNGLSVGSISESVPTPEPSETILLLVGMTAALFWSLAAKKSIRPC
jgi:hypothetical protein